MKTFLFILSVLFFSCSGDNDPISEEEYLTDFESSNDQSLFFESQCYELNTSQLGFNMKVIDPPSDNKLIYINETTGNPVFKYLGSYTFKVFYNKDEIPNITVGETFILVYRKTDNKCIGTGTLNPGNKPVNKAESEFTVKCAGEVYFIANPRFYTGNSYDKLRLKVISANRIN